MPQYVRPDAEMRNHVNTHLDQIVKLNSVLPQAMTLRTSKKGGGTHYKRLSTTHGRVMHQIGKLSLNRDLADTMELLVDYHPVHEWCIGDLDNPTQFKLLNDDIGKRLKVSQLQPRFVPIDSGHWLSRLPIDLSYRFHCDMDGVAADFESGFATHFHCSHLRISKEQMWSHIDSVPDFYSTLPMVPGADRLLVAIMERNHTMLSSSRTEHIAEHKRLWLEKINPRLHYTPVLPQDGVFDKTPYCKTNRCVLIDDYDHNVDQWRKAGGLAINHHNLGGTILSLHHLFLLATEWDGQHFLPEH